ncbi:MAG: hypothetical protein AAFO74_12475 [Pseudomonadota bacterium]
MTSSTLPPSSRDEEPIDVEFEPADIAADDRPASGGPGWGAFGLVSLMALSSFALAAYAAGLIPGLQPATGKTKDLEAQIETLQSALASDEQATGTLGTDVATLKSRADSLMADRTRTNTDLRNLRTEIETLEADIATLQRARVRSIADAAESDTGDLPGGDLSGLETRVSSLEDALVAQLSIYDGAVDALKARLDALEALAESNRLTDADASNARTEAALALSAIEASARRGRPFLTAYQQLAEAMPGNDAVARLAPLAPKAIPTLSDLRADLPELIDQALDQDAQSDGSGASLMRTLFGDGIQVRRADEVTARDHLDLATAALQAGTLSDAMAHIRAVAPNIQPVFTDWLNNAEDRAQLEQTLEALRLAMIAKDRP